jgi:hypothetical protein
VALVALAVALVATACQPRIGSNGPSFGNNLVGDLDGDGIVDPGDCVDPLAACAGDQPRFWASINSPYYSNDQGDPYSSRCISGTTCVTPTNPEFRPAGYIYGIEVAEAGQAVTVELYDAPAFYNPAYNYPGDTGSFRTQYELFGEDGSALSTSTDPALSLAGTCNDGPGRRNYPGGFQPAMFHNRWTTLCTFTAPTAGIYPLRVKTSDLAEDPSTGAAACTDCLEDLISGNRRPGMNSYAVRASTSAGPAPRVSALGDMGTYFPIPGGTATVPLVEVPDVNAGDRLVVDLYDPGDGNGTTSALRLQDPSGVTPPCALAYSTTTGTRTDVTGGHENYPSGCIILTRASGSARFNSRWVRLTVDIPPDYVCAATCWWTLAFNLGTFETSSERLTTVVSFEEPT